MLITEPASLPSDWRELRHSEKFAALRDSSNLIPGKALNDVEVDCRKRKIEDRNAKIALRFNRPTRGEYGSYAFKKADERVVHGRLDLTGSGNAPYKRIYILSEAMTSDGRKSIPRRLEDDELRQIAKLLATFDNGCDAPSGHHIETYVFLAKRDR